MRTWIVAIVLILILGPVSCTFSAQDIEYQRGEKAEQKKNYAEAVEHYRNVVDKYVKTDTALKAAEKAARISLYELHKYDDALVLYKHTVLYGKNEIERIQAQQKIAEICFSQTMNYTQAVIEFNRLLELPHTPLEGFNYQLSIARSYFYISNFFQAQIEIDSLLKKNYDKSLLFDALLLKANIFLTTKQIDEAIEVLKQLISCSVLVGWRAVASSIGRHIAD